MIDYTEVHRQADIIAKERIKNKKYREKMLDIVALREAHSIAYWEVIGEINSPKASLLCETCKKPK